MCYDKIFNSEDIVDALIELREIKHWTNYKVAVESDLPMSTISNVFNKKSMPQLDTLLAICKGFGINPSQLFGSKEKYEKLNDDESEIIKLWKKIDPKSQVVIKNLMNLLY